MKARNVIRLVLIAVATVLLVALSAYIVVSLPGTFWYCTLLLAAALSGALYLSYRIFCREEKFWREAESLRKGYVLTSFLAVILVAVIAGVRNHSLWRGIGTFYLISTLVMFYELQHAAPEPETEYLEGTVT
jgi:ribose/xylose/arabinose/galactoside ABC-type transport system permease subunit